MSIKPPTCRVCGVAEYRHRCMGALEIKAKAPAPQAKPAKKKGARP